jgi:pimeloyl-ACP methyl ester carboxylesterase
VVGDALQGPGRLVVAEMNEPLPIVLVPGLLTSPRVFAEQLPAMWRHGPVTIADHTRDDTMAAIASRILAHTPPRFALAGLSTGGYICFELTGQAPGRIERLAGGDHRHPHPPRGRRQARRALGGDQSPASAAATRRCRL